MKYRIIIAYIYQIYADMLHLHVQKSDLISLQFRDFPGFCLFHALVSLQFFSIVFVGVGASSASDCLMSPADGTAERSSASALLAGEGSAWLVFQVLFLHVLKCFGHGIEFHL